MTYKDLINDSLQKIASYTGDALSKKQAIEQGKDKFLEIDYHKEYGGYRIVSIKVEGGSAHPALGYSDITSRVGAKEMAQRLSDILRGIQLIIPDK